MTSPVLVGCADTVFVCLSVCVRNRASGGGLGQNRTATAAAAASLKAIESLSRTSSASSRPRRSRKRTGGSEISFDGAATAKPASICSIRAAYLPIVSAPAKTLLAHNK
jgi:hypothetical protein